ncbi:hypothetical protein ABW20_dc0110572 [Dactylellina cionopaga]|nr:hypothetical protein ABW20_dc0110572 [Dactylellina cionopaga]
MESFVFRDSPLAEYLEGEGENLAGLDWGNDADNNDSSSSTSSNPQPFNFAPPSLVLPKTRKKALRPLQIQNPHWYKRASVKDVLSGGLKSRLATGENLQFVERKKLRNLRTDTISTAEQFVENCQIFDVVVGNAITLIQEIELVSRGYRLSQPLPPITRLERADNSRKCARLRRTLAESFRLSIPPMCRAIEALGSFPRTSDLEKFYDVYDIRVCDLHEASSGGGIDETEFEDLESLRALKALFQRLYIVRKIFVCHLLALEANGGHRDHTQWHAVGTQLHTLGRLMADLATDAKAILMAETDFKIPPTPVPSTPNTAAAMLLSGNGGLSGANRERLRQQLRKFNGLSATTRGLQAKMHLLREATDKALQIGNNSNIMMAQQQLQQPQEPLGENFGPELLMQYDEIGADLRGLLAEWESGRASLASALEKLNSSGSPTNSRPVSMTFPFPIGSPGMSTAGTLVGGSPRTSGSWDETDRDAILRKRMSTGSDLLRLTTAAAAAAAASDEEEVFEAISEPGKGRERSKLNREERITKMKEDRQKALEVRRQSEASVSLVRELRDVLESRAAVVGGNVNSSIPSPVTPLQLKRRSLPAARSRLSLELIKVAEASKLDGGLEGRLSAPITPATRIAPIAFPSVVPSSFEGEKSVISPVQEVD